MILSVWPKHHIGFEVLVAVIADCGTEIFGEALLANGFKDNLKIASQHAGYGLVDGETATAFDHVYTFSQDPVGFLPAQSKDHQLGMPIGSDETECICETCTPLSEAGRHMQTVPAISSNVFGNLLVRWLQSEFPHGKTLYRLVAAIRFAGVLDLQRTAVIADAQSGHLDVRLSPSLGEARRMLD
jgi:hypothetical protein